MNRDKVARTCLALGMAVTFGCLRTSAEASGQSQESSPAPSGMTAHLRPGQFRIATIAAHNGESRFLASAGKVSPTCRFVVSMAKPASGQGTPFSFARAALVRERGSDCTALLTIVAKELAFDGHLPRPAPADRLAASVAILGIEQSRSASGSFSSNPPGPWTTMKLFVADGNGEVFLNLDPKDGIGEFSLKDEDYATVVVTKLARILLPKPGKS